METWRPIPGYEDLYEVSDRGHVRRGGRELKPSTVSGTGYKAVSLSRRSKVRRVGVHRLVAEAFIGPIPEGMQVCHNNGDRTDNRLENLRIDTPHGNAMDKRLHGTNYWANKTHCPSGHPYSPENTYENPLRPGSRLCRACRKAEGRRRYERRTNDRASARTLAPGNG